jgi:hypothetical protein
MGAFCGSIHIRKIPLLILSLLTGGFMAMSICHAADGQAGQYPQQLLTFSADKELQVRALATNLNIALPLEVSAFFKAATHGDYVTVSNTIDRLGPEFLTALKNPSGNPPTWLPFWQPMTEVESAYEAFAAGGTKYPMTFGNGIIKYPFHREASFLAAQTPGGCL